MILKPSEKLTLHSDLGRDFAITAIFSNMAEANGHMEKTEDACIAAVGDETRGEFIFLANRSDKGIKATAEKPPRFPIGTRFHTRGKFPRVATVVDIHTTRNLAGEVVKLRYMATYELTPAHVVTDYDVCETSIAMRLIDQPTETKGTL